MSLVIKMMLRQKDQRSMDMRNWETCLSSVGHEPEPRTESDNLRDSISVLIRSFPVSHPKTFWRACRSPLCWHWIQAFACVRPTLPPCVFTSFLCDLLTHSVFPFTVIGDHMPLLILRMSPHPMPARVVYGGFLTPSRWGADELLKQVRGPLHLPEVCGRSIQCIKPSLSFVQTQGHL